MIEVKTNSRISNRDHAACSADDVCIMYVLCIRNTAKTESIFNQFSITLVCHFMSHFVCMFVCLLMTTNRYYLRIENSTTISLNDRLLTELNCMQYIHSEMQGRCESIISYNYEYFGELFIVVAATHSVLQCLRCGCNAVVLVVPRAQHTHAHLHTQQKQRFSSWRIKHYNIVSHFALYVFAKREWIASAATSNQFSMLSRTHRHSQFFPLTVNAVDSKAER